MSLRKVRQLLQPRATSEGAGVTVYRTIGTPGLRNLDPFLMMDFFCSDNPDEYIAGFPSHPHRGFVTFTYMLDGHMQHQDSMGNQGELLAGGTQWMKAASGVIHSEMPKQVRGLMRGFQLWINLPASEKMSAPGYQEYSQQAIPVWSAGGVKVKVLIGQYHDQRGPIQDDITQVQYLDVQLKGNALFSQAVESTHVGFIYVIEGAVTIDNETLPAHGFAVLTEGDQLAIQGKEQGARFIIVLGKPIKEPIVQYGPFVMNTQEEIQQALLDYREGRLVQEKANRVTDDYKAL